MNRRMATLLLNAGLIILACISLVPVLWMVSASFMIPGEASAVPLHFIPFHPTFEHYRALADRMKTEAARQTAVLQAWLTERLGQSPWFGGETFGWADAAVAPMVNRSVHYGMGPALGSPLANWHSRLRDRPSVATTFAEFDAVATRMGDLAGAYASGERQREYRDHRLEWMVKSGGIDRACRFAR